MSNKEISIRDFCRHSGQLVELDPSNFLPLPPPYDKLELQPKFGKLSEANQKKLESDLDGVSAFKFPRPQTDEEKRILVEKFLSGLRQVPDLRDRLPDLQRIRQAGYLSPDFSLRHSPPPLQEVCQDRRQVLR
jgi:hypothetical protein